MTISKRAFAIAFIVTLMIVLSAWQGGNVSSSTLNVTAFSARTTAGVSSVFQNIGASSHWLTYCPAAGTTSLQIEIEGSFDNTLWFGISPVGTTSDGGCSTLEAGGYFPYVRANLLAIAGGTPSVTAYYSSSAFPIAGGGISQLGKTPQPVTYTPGLTGGTTLVNTCPGGVGSWITMASGPLVVYGFQFTALDAAVLYVEIVDDGNSNRDVGFYQVPASGTKEVTLPPQGLQILGNLKVRACTNVAGTGAPVTGANVIAYTKGAGITVSSSVTSGGSKSNSRQSY